MANTTDIPEDIQDEYYEPERKERTGVAWLLAIGTLILTVLLATGLFFAGRWTYRQIAGTDEDSNGGQTEIAGNNDQAQEERADGGNGNGGRTAQQSADSDSPNGAGNGGGAAAGANDDGNDGANGNGDDDQPQAQPETGDSGRVAADTTENDDDLPETGPADTAAVFVAVTFAGYLFHRLYLQKSES